MSWIVIIAVALFGIGLAALTIALVENHHRVAPIAARCEFALWASFGVMAASSSWDHWSRGETVRGIIFAVIAGVLLCVAAATFRKAGRERAAAAGSRDDRPDH